MLASLSIGFNSTNAEIKQASLNPVRATDYLFCTKILLIRNFVPQSSSERKFWEYQS